MSDALTIFPYKHKDSNDKPHAFKWQQGQSKYEVYSSTLDDLGIAVLVPHCIETFNKLDTVISTKTHKGPSCFKVFPRTLSVPLQAMWDVVKDDLEDFAETTAKFREYLEAFIAAHATEDDRHNLLQQIMNAQKP